MAQQIMPEIDLARCTLCGDCLSRCPQGALSIAAQRLTLDEQRCSYCGSCEDICPVGAIALPYEISIRNRPDGRVED